MTPTPDPNAPTPAPVRLWETHRALQLYLESAIIPRTGYLADSALGYSAFAYNANGDPLFISFDRFGRIFTRKLPIASDEYSGVSLSDGGASFAMYYEDPAFTKLFRFRRFDLSQTIGDALQVDHLGANDFRWAFAGSGSGWVMAVLRYPNRLSIHRIDSTGALIGTTELQTPADLPSSVDWLQAEFSGDRVLVAYPISSSGAPVNAWIIGMDGTIYTPSPISIPAPLIDQAIAGDENGDFFYLASSSFGNRIYRLSGSSIAYDHVIDIGSAVDIEWLENRLWAIDSQNHSLIGFDEDAERVEGPIDVFPPGWDRSLAWLDLRKSGPDLGAFFYDPDASNNMYYMQIEAGPLVTPTPTPAPGVPTGETVDIDLGGGVTLAMVKIPRGSFQQGGSSGDPDVISTELPQHTVTISKDFWIGKYEITNQQIRRFDPAHNSLKAGPYNLNDDSYPAVNLTWNKAQAFCDWLTDNTDYTFSLPTEAEWEYACRAGTDTRRYWGDDADNDQACSLANVADISSATDFGGFRSRFPCDDGFPVTSPVGTFSANPYGLHDMLGNVWEWCADWYSAYPADAQVDPAGPERGKSKIIRGGSWQDGPAYVRASVRSAYQPDQVYAAIGFRVVIRE
ncbi:MAG: SUMF1/EgtB/PvdO family nonheme iron enzyme [bacterium]|nr:SUMF1/EgtB/PvdO family nonheme iron enzyme [bacterium]